MNQIEQPPQSIGGTQRGWARRSTLPSSQCGYYSNTLCGPVKQKGVLSGSFSDPHPQSGAEPGYRLYSMQRLGPVYLIVGWKSVNLARERQEKKLDSFRGGSENRVGYINARFSEPPRNRIGYAQAMGGSDVVDCHEHAQALIAEQDIAIPRFAARGGIVGGQEDLVDVQDGIVGHAESLAAGADIPGIGTQAIAVDR